MLYIRHTSTDFSKDDSKMASCEDCANQRPLTDKGRDEARGDPVSNDDPKRYDALRTLLATPPGTGTNNVVSSHGNPYMAVFGGPYLAEGEIAVVRPGGKPGFEAVARIKLGEWETLQP